MSSLDVMVWLLAAQVAIGVVGLALLGFAVWKMRALGTALAMSVAGAEWKIDKLGDVFASAVASIELTASATAASSVAIQTIARDLRPLEHTNEPPDSFSSLIQPGV